MDAVSVSLNASTAEGYEAICHSQYGLQAFPAILKFTSTAVFNVPHVRMTVVSTMPKEEIDACSGCARKSARTSLCGSTSTSKKGVERPPGKGGFFAAALTGFCPVPAVQAHFPRKGHISCQGFVWRGRKMVLSFSGRFCYDSAK